MRNPVGLSAECYDKHFAIFILIKNIHLLHMIAQFERKKPHDHVQKWKWNLLDDIIVISAKK